MVHRLSVLHYLLLLGFWSLDMLKDALVAIVYGNSLVALNLYEAVDSAETLASEFRESAEEVIGELLAQYENTEEMEAEPLVLAAETASFAEMVLKAIGESDFDVKGRQVFEDVIGTDCEPVEITIQYR